MKVNPESVIQNLLSKIASLELENATLKAVLEETNKNSEEETNQDAE